MSNNSEYENYLNEYNTIKHSSAVNKLSHWKLMNCDEPFDKDKYSQNIDSFMNDINDAITLLDDENKDK